MSRTAALFLLIVICAAPSLLAEEESEEARRFRGGALRLGAFWVFGIDTTVAAKSQRFPLGAHIDLSRDLGISDSATVPRGLLSFRFNRRSQVDFDWYRIERSSVKRLERSISIGPVEFPIGFQVAAFTDVSIYKGVYSWLFHDDPKVTLGLSIGLNVVDFEAGIDAGPDRIGDDSRSEQSAVTAPLPVIGGRLVYRINPKLEVLFTADVLMVSYGDYSGTFQDVHALAEYRLSKRFGLGGGLNVLGLDLEIDGDDRLGKVQQAMTGVVVYGAVYF
jgi:hypothetical protein